MQRVKFTPAPTTPLRPQVSSSTVISLTFSATDDDTTSSDDPLGTVSNSLGIANGFGVFTPIDQKNNDFEVGPGWPRSREQGRLGRACAG